MTFKWPHNLKRPGFISFVRWIFTGRVDRNCTCKKMQCLEYSIREWGGIGY